MLALDQMFGSLSVEYWSLQHSAVRGHSVPLYSPMLSEGLYLGLAVQLCHAAHLPPVMASFFPAKNVIGIPITLGRLR